MASALAFPQRDREYVGPESFDTIPQGRTGQDIRPVHPEALHRSTFAVCLGGLTVHGRSSKSQVVSLAIGWVLGCRFIKL